MILKQTARKIKAKLMGFGKANFVCPICDFRGAFLTHRAHTSERPHCRCPICHSVERHRLQKLVLDIVLGEFDASQGKILHFAPETFFQERLKKQFRYYVSSDLNQPDVDVQCDITDLPFSSEEFDFVFASHVLEHVKDDLKALSEIKRILKPGGIAVLPVPIVNNQTVEYPNPNPHETNHVRAPGLDYFERYQIFFSRVELFRSSDFPEQYQTYIYEDRSQYPNEKSPLRSPSFAEKYEDIVPICRA